MNTRRNFLGLSIASVVSLPLTSFGITPPLSPLRVKWQRIIDHVDDETRPILTEYGKELCTAELEHVESQFFRSSDFPSDRTRKIAKIAIPAVRRKYSGDLHPMLRDASFAYKGGNLVIAAMGTSVTIFSVPYDIHHIGSLPVCMVMGLDRNDIAFVEDCDSTLSSIVKHLS